MALRHVHVNLLRHGCVGAAGRSGGYSLRSITGRFGSSRTTPKPAFA